MAEFESDDQQVEAIKKWWSENGTSLIVGLVLGVAALFGWREYVSYQTEHAAEASDLFQAAQVQFASKDMTEAQAAKADTLRAEYADTPYAALVSLAQAKFDYENGKTEDALKHLRWARDNAIEDDVRHIAQLRVIRILLEQKNYDEASLLLDSDHPAGFTAGYEELKGDLHVARGEIDQARVAYDKAILAAGGEASRWLLLKRQELGTTDSAISINSSPPA